MRTIFSNVLIGFTYYFYLSESINTVKRKNKSVAFLFSSSWSHCFLLFVQGCRRSLINGIVETRPLRCFLVRSIYWLSLFKSLSIQLRVSFANAFIYEKKKLLEWLNLILRLKSSKVFKVQQKRVASLIKLFRE